jgi:hypothetical protein
VSIERQLKEDYERTRPVDPARTGAYDRFVRRRARYARRMAAAASVTLAAAVALAVSVPRLLADRDDVAGLPKSQLVSRPELGYELVVPSGWHVVGDGYYGLLLEPRTSATGSVPPGAAATTTTAPQTTVPQSPGRTTPPPAGAPRSLPSAMIAVAPVILDPSDYPGLPTGTPSAQLPEGPQLNGGPQPERLQGRFESGRRADGRAYVRYEISPMLASGQTYYLAWPYHCAAGVRCPVALRYRALRVTGGVLDGDGQGLQAVRAALRRILDSVRPVTSTLPGGATTNRRACRLRPPTDPLALPRSSPLRGAPLDGGSPRVRVSMVSEGVLRGTSGFSMSFSSDLAMCHLQERFTVEVLESGRRVAVQGDSTMVTLDGDLPEGDGEFPTFSKAWLWRNWCGNPNATVTIRFRGLDGYELDAVSAIRPPCIDRGKPSTLQLRTLDYGG